MRDQAGLLPEWAVAELRRPVASSSALRERIMAGVRASRPVHSLPAHPKLRGRGGGEATLHRPLSSVWAARRGNGLRAAAAVALAASIAGVAATSALRRSHAPPSARIAGTTSGRMIVLGDTVDSALHDTLRLVRFVLDAPAAARVALVGDFNDWSRTATPLTDSAGSGVWSVVLALGPGSRRYSFVVDDTQWVGATPSDSNRAAGSAPLRAAPVGGDSI